MCDISSNLRDASFVKIQRKKEIIKLIIRQTNYEKEKAEERLVFWKNNYLDVIKEYMNPEYVKEKKRDNGGSVNKRVWGEISSPKSSY